MVTEIRVEPYLCFSKTFTNDSDIWGGVLVWPANCPYVIHFQNLVDSAKPLLRKAIQISQQTPYWHCRLLFQLAVCITSVVLKFSYWRCTDRRFCGRFLITIFFVGLFFQGFDMPMQLVVWFYFCWFIINSKLIRPNIKNVYITYICT